MIRGAGGERVVAMDDFHVGPYETAVGDGRDADRGAGRRSARAAAARTRRSSDGSATGPSPPPSAAVWLDGGHDRRTPASALAAVGRRTSGPRARRGAAARQGADGGALRAGGPDRRRGLLPDRRPARARSTTSAISPASSPSAHSAAPSPAPRTGGLTMQVTMTVNGEQVDARRRAAPAARPLRPRHARPHRHPLGLRHVELRHLRRAGWTASRSRAARCWRRWRRPRDPHRGGPRGGRRARPGADGRS